MELSDEVISGIKTAAKRISGHGSLTLCFISGGIVDIEITDRVRLQEKGTPKAGEVVKERRTIVIRQERQG